MLDMVFLANAECGPRCRKFPEKWSSIRSHERIGSLGYILPMFPGSGTQLRTCVLAGWGWCWWMCVQVQIYGSIKDTADCKQEQRHRSVQCSDARRIRCLQKRAFLGSPDSLTDGSGMKHGSSLTGDREATEQRKGIIIVWQANRFVCY